MPQGKPGADAAYRSRLGQSCRVPGAQRSAPGPSALPQQGEAGTSRPSARSTPPPPPSALVGEGGAAANPGSGVDSDIELIDELPGPSGRSGGGRNPGALPQQRHQRRRQRQQQQAEVIDLSALGSSSEDDEVQVVRVQHPAKRQRTPGKSQQRRRSGEGAGAAAVAAQPKSPPPRAKQVVCPICLEEIQDGQMASTVCGHVFCFACVSACVKAQKRCPSCRKSLAAKNSFHKLFMPS